MKVVIGLVVVIAATEAVRLRYRRPGNGGASSAADTAGSGSSPAWCKNYDCPTFKVLQKTDVRKTISHFRKDLKFDPGNRVAKDRFCHHTYNGPVVQSIVSLTTSLRHQLFLSKC